MKRITLALALLAVCALAPAHASEELAKKHGCVACHNVKGPKTVGPTHVEIAKRYAGDRDAEAKLADKVRKGGVGIWGQVPMPPNPNVPEADARALVRWMLGAK